MRNDKKLVLIADDYDHAAVLLAELVQHDTAFDAASAKDGVEAIEIAQLRRPWVAILDIDMPRLGGIEAASQMRTMFGVDRPYLIALSGGHAREARVSHMFDHILTKPVNLTELLECLRCVP